jgi:CheY-like chemotaxis protein
MIVEGSVESGDTLRLALLGAGHDPLFVRTPREAVVLAPRFSPQVVVCELFAEKTDGYHWWRKLRRDRLPAQTRFIAALDEYDAAALVLAREAGFDYVLGKPVEAFSLDEYLVGASSSRWRMNPGLPHPWTPSDGSITPEDRSRIPDLLDEGPARDALSEFLVAMRELAAKESPDVLRLLGPLEVPPVALLRHLKAVREALDAAHGGDPMGGRQILQDALTVARAAPPQPWSEELCERYQLALRTYCSQHEVDGASSGWGLPTE